MSYLTGPPPGPPAKPYNQSDQPEKPATRNREASQEMLSNTVGKNVPARWTIREDVGVEASSGS